MTSQGCNKSKLAEMQMRFQLRQQQEREQRKSEMAINSITTSGKSIINNDTDTIVMTTTTEKIQKKILSSSIGPGKVRQMFDERRQRSTGIDKSYPLKPIQGLSTRANVIQSTTNQRQHISTNLKQANTIPTSTIRQKSDSFNGNVKTYNIFEQDIIDADLHQISDKDLMNEASQNIQSLNLGKQQAKIIKTRDENVLDNYKKDNNVNVTNNRAQNNSNLKPVITKKEPPTELLNRNFKSTKKVTSKNNNENDTKRSPSTPSPVSTKSTKNTQSKLELIKTISNGNINNNGMSSCRICDRNFSTDRLEKHEQICQKMAKKKRKIYDAVKHRVAGTDAEKYVKNTKNRTNSVNSTVAKTNAKSYTNPNPTTTTKTNWRKTHEDFINAIRAAKQVKAHLAKGGKLSDLPPPPPTEHLDYIQCPHCNRKFNQSAAERHIPKCATFLHNKPKSKSPKIAKGLKQRH